MQNVVWKYKIESHVETLSVPIGAKFLSCQIQDNKICVWFLTDMANKNNLEQRVFRTLFTGEPFNTRDNYEYIGTVQNPLGVVYHVFEVIK